MGKIEGQKFKVTDQGESSCVTNLLRIIRAWVGKQIMSVSAEYEHVKLMTTINSAHVFLHVVIWIIYGHRQQRTFALRLHVSYVPYPHCSLRKEPNIQLFRHMS